MNKKNVSEKAVGLIDYCSQKGRVCPLPDGWLKLWNMLPNKTRVGIAAWNPSLPLILAAWHDTPAIMKMLRLLEHIEWADANDAIDEVDSFLRGLGESGWHHFDE